MRLLKSLLLLLVPGVLYAAALYLQLQATIPEAWQPLFSLFPYLAVAAGLYFGWRFNRTRVIWALLILVLVERVLMLSKPMDREFFLQAAMVLVPMNLVLFNWWTERGLLTKHGLLRLLFLLLQIGAVAWLFLAHAGEVVDLLGRSWVDSSSMEIIPPLQLPLLVMLISMAGLLMRFYCKPEALEGAFCWVLADVMTGLWRPEHFSMWVGVAAFQLTIAVVENSFKMAFNDELTGLPARRAMNEYLLKVGRRYTLAMVDVDHFKKVNDIHGHDVGDQVLRMVATYLRRVTGGGRAYRYGGEEFAIIFPSKDLERALPHLDELREAIAQARFVIRGRKRPRQKPEKLNKKNSGKAALQVTVSIGVATRDEKNASLDKLFKAADQALYKAKKGGRNQICS